jgi:hypothetical protein
MISQYGQECGLRPTEEEKTHKKIEKIIFKKLSKIKYHDKYNFRCQLLSASPILS